MLISYYLPPKQLTNEDLAAQFDHPDWTPEKIFRKVGVRTRHIEEHELASDLAVHAAERLFEEHGVSRDDIDFVILCTGSPDYLTASTVCIVQDKLGLPTSVGSLRIDFGCSGFVYSLLTAKGILAADEAKSVLVLTSEIHTRDYHPKDRAGRVLFGDCATAALVTQDDLPNIGKFVCGTDGSGFDDIIKPAGGSAMPYSPEAMIETVDDSGNVRTPMHTHMNGVNIFTFARHLAPALVRDTLAKNGLTMDDIDYFILHQANRMILVMLMKLLKLTEDKFCIDIEDVGNTASNTIPLALYRAKQRTPEKFHKGAKILIAGFGIGLSWAGTVLTM